jgi:hypothetical protein
METKTQSKTQRNSLRSEALIEVASFLAKAWSGTNSVQVVMTADEVPKATKYSLEDGRRVEYEIKMCELSKFRVKDIMARYRLWRQALWHESMHIAMGFPDLGWADGELLNIIANAIEDYRVEALGAMMYLGMKKETEFAHAIYVSKADRDFAEFARINHSSSVREIALLSAFVFKTVAGRIPRSIANALSKEDLEKVAELAGEARRDIMAGVSLESISLRVYEELKKMGVRDNPILVSSVPGSLIRAYDNPYAYDSERYDSKREIERAVKEHASELGLNEDLSEPGEDVKKEFEAISRESERIENEEASSKRLGAEKKGGESDRGAMPGVGREGAGVKHGRRIAIAVPRLLKQDDSPLYDQSLIARLKDQLRNVKRGFFEVYRSAGDELDVEEYVRGIGKPFGKPFLDEERVRMGGIKALILMDFSASIMGYELEYKKAVVALSEALKYIRAKFAVYAFSNPSGEVVLWQIKGFQEAWDRAKSRRLAQIYPIGDTPLDEVYKRLEEVIEAERPDIMITLTDGEPNSFEDTEEEVKRLKRMTKMVAVAIGRSPEEAGRLAGKLISLGYHRSIAVSSLSELASKILRLIQG